MRVSDKGQITIPKYIRELTGIHVSSEVELTVEDGRVVISAKQKTREEDAQHLLKRFMAALERLEGTGDPLISATEVMAATRDRDI